MSDTTAVLSPEKTEEDRKINYLFVCTGNTCRSPMAAALFNHLYGDESAHAISAGLAADGSPISKNAAEALMERGVLPSPSNDYLHHVSKCVDEKILSEASLIITMTSSHAMSLIMNYPAFVSKIAVMPKDITDPFGGDLDVYKKCLSDIEEALCEIFADKRSPISEESSDGKADE
ncbi:MAG: low molecular weight protein arginine phosphatase [Clostridiales bacterium]|nr:low molecular weight protein arginine phosphatase [Clostridiales bacterium]